jgi:hypothetical protein
MKKNDAYALEFIAVTVASLQGILNAQILQGYFDGYLLYVVSAIAVGFFFFLFRKRTSFPVEITGVACLLAYGFLRFIYSLGIQLPGKGRDVFLQPIYSLAFGYVGATGALACLIIFLGSIIVN